VGMLLVACQQQALRKDAHALHLACNVSAGANSNEEPSEEYHSMSSTLKYTLVSVSAKATESAESLTGVHQHAIRPRLNSVQICLYVDCAWRDSMVKPAQFAV
jgi:hypothetical protein